MAIKILTASQIREADAYTIKHEPITSIDLMERAAVAFTDKLLELLPLYQKPVAILCGTGNNGGDGLAVARLLRSTGCDAKVYVVGALDKASTDFRTNYERAILQNIHITWLKNADDLGDISHCYLAIDALFGTGLSRPVDGLYKSVIDYVNLLKLTTVSIDVPSGLICDGPNAATDSIIQATHTITFQQPKLSFLMAESGRYCGELHVVDIGLSKQYMANTFTPYTLTEAKDLCFKNLLHRDKFSHKGNYGHLVLAAGIYGKAGAAILAAKAALRGGVGLLTMQTPIYNIPILQTAVPEAMCLPDAEELVLSSFGANFADAYAIGPGIGTNNKTANGLFNFLQQNTKPTVLDADALNIVAQQLDKKEWLGNHVVITPHPKEFDRLAGTSANGFERLQKARNFAIAHQTTVVLKGAYTAVINTTGEVVFNPTGNPGMATAGSGDVLTGIIGALLARGIDPLTAARAGVYCHGLAGDIAAKQKTETCLVASDIIEFLPSAAQHLNAAC